MPFKSKAQQRLMFAKHPQIAKRWAGETEDIKSLPEKVEKPMSKTADVGRFFRDMNGRDDGMFMGKIAAESAGASANPASIAQSKTDETSKLNIGATGAPMGGSGFRGDGMGGGMYGTGTGAKPAYGTGKPAMKKGAAIAPSDWDADSGMPTGFHRPAREQPEALEEGGERFHSTESNSVVPASNRQRHGVVEGGSMTLRASSSPQMGKHASVRRYMGTSFGFEKSAWDSDPSYYRKPPRPQGKGAAGWVGDRASEFKGSLGKAVGGIGSGLGEAVKGVTTSPLGATLATVLAAKFGVRGAKGLARSMRNAKPVAKTVANAAPAAAKSGGLVGKLMGGARNLVSGASHFVTK